MKVAAVSQVGWGGGRSFVESGLRPEVVRTVLEIYSMTGGPTYFRIESGDGGVPALYDSRGFDVVSDAVSPSWVVSVGPEGMVRLAPRPWLEAGYWEALSDGEPGAIEIFESERSRMEQFDE